MMSEQIFISSLRQILSEAIANHIHKYLGYSCFHYPEHSRIKPDLPKNGSKTRNLIDSTGIIYSDLRDRLKKEDVSESGHDYRALFSVSENIIRAVEIEAFMQGYRGFSRDNMPLRSVH
jgi:hypothetical protein